MQLMSFFSPAMQTTDPYANFYARGQVRDPAAFESYDEAELFDDSASNVFGVEDDIFHPSDDLALRRAQTLDGRSRGLSNQLHAAEP